MNRVWIELDPPASNDEGHTRAEAACRMLKRCGLDFGANRPAVWWNERKQHYCFTLDGSGTFVEANDHGHWYSLDYFGRREDQPRPLCRTHPSRRGSRSCPLTPPPSQPSFSIRVSPFGK